jgi:hypothetical protein
MGQGGAPGPDSAFCRQVRVVGPLATEKGPNRKSIGEVYFARRQELGLKDGTVQSWADHLGEFGILNYPLPR